MISPSLIEFSMITSGKITDPPIISFSSRFFLVNEKQKQKEKTNRGNETKEKRKRERIGLLLRRFPLVNLKP